jgi:hypothetical protein
MGVMDGTYSMVFDTTLASTYNPAFVTANGGTVAAAEAALFAGMIAGLAPASAVDLSWVRSRPPDRRGRAPPCNRCGFRETLT